MDTRTGNILEFANQQELEKKLSQPEGKFLKPIPNEIHPLLVRMNRHERRKYYSQNKHLFK